MTVFIIVAIILTLASTAAIAWPLVFAKPAGKTSADDGDALATQLAEIERDRDYGLIDEPSAEDAIRQAAATATQVKPEPARAGKAGRGARLIAAFIIGAMPVGAAFLYLDIGAPYALSEAGRQAASTQAEDQAAENAAAIAAMAPDERAAIIERMVAGLADRLAGQPDDVDGWRMLGRSYAALGNFAQSTDAWREAASRSGEAEDLRELAAALLSDRDAEDNQVNAELNAVLEALLAGNENDPLALYFLGHAAAQNGDADTAVAYWTKLRASLPPDSPLTPKLDGLIADALPQAEAQDRP
ncbi:MAG: c-type cytochrome biogenesis protein CcmI [Alphaproteobacteria bacterium]|nr:c-type cytochrome biogenesis protein CcmI [Alphaproteobacteria bacterium]